jgi:hypothetical protein
MSDDECFNATFGVGAVPKSFVDKTKFLRNVYNSHPKPHAIAGDQLRLIAGRLSIPIEEVLSWFDLEKKMREDCLACKNVGPSNLPLSPSRTTTHSLNYAVNMNVSHYTSLSPDTSAQINEMFPITVPSKHLTVPLKGKQGRPRKNHSSTRSNTPSPNAKRHKLLSYLCPDCNTLWPDNRWLEHVKRIHFPNHVWKCQEADKSTGRPCSKIYTRLDYFGTHLTTIHGPLVDEEITRLKITSKLEVVNLFHQICGFSGCNHDPFESRKDSIEHIKAHFKGIAEQHNPPEDMGISQWQEKCPGGHELTRGVHYHVTQAHDDPERDRDDRDEDGPGDGGSSSQPPDHSGLPPGSGTLPSRGDGSFNADNFDTEYSPFMGYSQYSGALGQDSSIFDNNARSSIFINYGLERSVLPFTPLRILGMGGHGQVHEVTDRSSTQTFARKSVMRKGKEPATSSRLFHLNNELSILKELSHPHLVKVIGGYIDSTYAHIIMSPVADQNLADRLSKSLGQMQLVQWIESLASATSYLHGKGIRHLDIKPQNILLKGDTILLADFGTAKYFTEFTEDLDEDLAVTPMYCAPETIYHRRQEYGSDIFSLGCVFSEMLTRYFGYSIEQFESFRTKNGGKAFYLTMPAVKEWIAVLPRCTRCTNPEQPRKTIFQMLDEDPSARPEARKLQFDFSGIDRCPAHGDIRTSEQS